MMRSSFKYAWAFVVGDQSTGPLLFVGEDGKPLGVASGGEMYVVRGEELVKAESWTVTWDQATISYVLP